MEKTALSQFSGSIQGKDYSDFIGEPLAKWIVAPFLLRNSITEVDQYLANVKFCFATFGLHPSRADGSVPFLCSGPWSHQRNPGDDSFRELKFLFEVASRCLNSGIGNGSDFQLVVVRWTRVHSTASYRPPAHRSSLASLSRSTAACPKDWNVWATSCTSGSESHGEVVMFFPFGMVSAGTTHRRQRRVLVDDEVETPTALCVTDIGYIVLKAANVSSCYVSRAGRHSGRLALTQSRGLVIAVLDFCPELAILTR